MKIISTLTDYLISQKYKKWSPGKYAMLLYVAVSIRWISIRFDAGLNPTLPILHGGFIGILFIKF